MEHQATYSPEDNKLRMYPAFRLDKDDYSRMKSAGFKWAPKQELFVAPTWTPQREDLLIEFCGEISDEDTSLVERAEESADRFSEYSGNRARDAHAARTEVDRIADGIPVGQPILVGHHSEKRARKDKERIENGMRKAIRMWDQAQYWKDRAAGAIRNAKYKERPDVRHRRIKRIEADRRKQERTRQSAVECLAVWEDPELTHEKAVHLCNWKDHIHHCFTLDEYPRDEPASQYEGRMSLWSALDGGVCTYEQARDIAVPAHKRTIEWCDRWLAHYDNRLAYERAMLGEQGGDKGKALSNIEKGGQVLIGTFKGDAWFTVLKVNKSKATGGVNSVSTNNTDWPRVVSIEKVKDYRPPTEEQKKATKKATANGPLCNYRRGRCAEMTKAQYTAMYKGNKAYWKVEDKELAPHRLRRAYGFAIRNKGGTLPEMTEEEKAGPCPDSNFSHSWFWIYLTDQKEKLPPDRENDTPVELPVEHVPPDLERAQKGLAKREERKQAGQPFEDLRKTLRTGGVRAVSAPQLFPTPAAIVRKVLQYADIEPGHDILEPSAGTGALLSDPDGEPGADLLNGEGRTVAVEINHELAEMLRKSRPAVDVRCCDFLKCNGDLGKFDRIVMNPPFERGADIKHILRALTFLKGGGRLVAVCANGPRQREWLQDAATIWEDLPPGSFKESGTNVNAAIAVIDIPPNSN